MSVRPVATNRQQVNVFLSNWSHPQNGISAHVFVNVCVCVFYVSLYQQILNEYTSQHPLTSLINTNFPICTFEIVVVKIFFYILILKHVTVTNIQFWRDMTLGHWVWIPNVLKEYMYLDLFGSIHTSNGRVTQPRIWLFSNICVRDLNPACHRHVTSSLISRPAYFVIWSLWRNENKEWKNLCLNSKWFLLVVVLFHLWQTSKLAGALLQTVYSNA
jgi:hypothetical protein